jgi:hypothetical protein
MAIAERVDRSRSKEIQETFASVSEGLKPVNLVKNGLRSVSPGNHRDELANILLGIGNRNFKSQTDNWQGQGIHGKNGRKAIQWGMAGLVSKKAERIKEKAGEVIDKIFKKRKPGSNHSPAPSPAPDKEHPAAH